MLRLENVVALLEAKRVGRPDDGQRNDDGDQVEGVLPRATLVDDVDVVGTDARGDALVLLDQRRLVGGRGGEQHHLGLGRLRVTTHLAVPHPQPQNNRADGQ